MSKIVADQYERTPMCGRSSQAHWDDDSISTRLDGFVQGAKTVKQGSDRGLRRSEQGMTDSNDNSRDCGTVRDCAAKPTPSILSANL